MQHAKDLLFEVGQANYITVLDLTKGYWQIPMTEEAKPYTAFVTHNGHYKFCVMPFGMKNAGSTFQKVMDQVLVKHRAYCRSYIDDVAVFSKSWEQLISTKKEIRSFLGLTSYYREYIPNFASLVLPLTELTKNRVPNIIPWNEAAEQAFTKLKAQLVKIKGTTSLYTPNLSNPYQLYTDASVTAIGACLCQNDKKGKENPIEFFIKKLTETQNRWANIEREAYAVIEALTYLTLTTPQSAKLTRWALTLQRYNIAISYRKGVKHGNADALPVSFQLHRPGMTDDLFKGRGVGVERSINTYYRGWLVPPLECGDSPCGQAGQGMRKEFIRSLGTTE
ncbi:retrovirus-related Pol polyprotein from transposon 297 [Trichonephila clavipes]|nr:retrovirus-related Pol polyprotein from transposon 297 [Trichonephila clavipes]